MMRGGLVRVFRRAVLVSGSFCGGGRAALSAAAPTSSSRSGSSVVVSQSLVELASAEGDDAADRIVGRNTHGHSVSWHDLDAEAAHTAAQLGQHFVTRIYLHTIQTAAMNGDDGALHINEIVLAQICCPFNVPAYQYHSGERVSR